MEAGRWLLVYRKTLAEMAFGQEAGGSEPKGRAIQAEGTARAKAPRQVHHGGKRLVWVEQREAGGE